MKNLKKEIREENNIGGGSTGYAPNNKKEKPWYLNPTKLAKIIGLILLGLMA